MAELGYFLSCEENGPRQLVRYAQMGEKAGLSDILISDHFHPWIERQGESPFVWSVIGGIAASTDCKVTTGVTCPTVRIRPAIVAQAAIPNLVVTEDLAWANALLGHCLQRGAGGRPLLGGALVAASGAGLVFAVNAASFAASGVMIAFTAGSFGGRRGSGGATLDHRARDFFAGFRVIVSNRSLAPLSAASALAYASFGAALVIDPALSRFFHAGSVGYGLLTTVWGGGAVVGAILAGRVVNVSRAHAAVAWGMAAMAVSLGSVALLPTFALIVAAGAIGGTGSGFVFIPWLLLIQHHSSDAVRGRVVAAAEAFDQIAFLAGMGAAVPAISIAKPNHAYALAGIFLLCATAVVAATGRFRDLAVEPAA